MRSIGGALGVDHKTVMSDVQRVGEIGERSPISQPERVTRQGGGSYPSRRPTVVPGRDDREGYVLLDAATRAYVSGPFGELVDAERAVVDQQVS